MKHGTLAAFSAYFLWGLLPIYWKAVNQIPAAEVLAHRIVWSFIFLALLLTVRRRWAWARPSLRQPRILLTFLVTTVLLGLNWGIYIWAVNSNYIVDASLGYFINPLVNVLLAVVFLKEELRRGQLVAVVIAAAGVLYLALSFGVVLWISLALALSFGIYGLLRKTAALGAFEGLTLETAFMALPALIFLIVVQGTGSGAFVGAKPTTQLLLAATGVVTTVPLVLFGYGAQRVRLITLGILQYIAPSLQFLLGVLVYDEAFTRSRVIGFGIIWFALAVYTMDSMGQSRRRRAARRVGLTGAD